MEKETANVELDDLSESDFKLILLVSFTGNNNSKWTKVDVARTSIVLPKQVA